MGEVVMISALKNQVHLKLNSQTISWGGGAQENNPFVLMAGPDIFEDYSMVLEVAQEMKKVTTELKIPWILKCSFDKANRQSSKSFRGIGMKEALQGLEKIKSLVGCALISDLHDITQVDSLAAVVDVLQIPAFLCRQTDLLQAAAKTGKVINIKKGQFVAPWDMKSIAQKCVDVGNSNILLCERGNSFGSIDWLLIFQA